MTGNPASINHQGGITMKRIIAAALSLCPHQSLGRIQVALTRQDATTTTRPACTTAIDAQ